MHEETIPGKLYDYFRASRPILVIGPEGCDAGKLVEETNRGIAVGDDDDAAIEAALHRLLPEKNRDGADLNLSPEAVERFTRSAMVGEMLDFFQEIIENTPDQSNVATRKN